MSKILFVKNEEETEKYDFDVFKAKPINLTEEGKEL